MSSQPKLKPNDAHRRAREDIEKRHEEGLKTLLSKPEAQEAQALVPSRAATTALTAIEPTGDPTQDYLNAYASTTIPGTSFRFNGKDGKYVKLDGVALDLKEDDVFVFLSDQIWCGWIKFDKSDEHNPPIRIQGLLSDGFKMPPRDSLDDNDASQWQVGLSGQPEDPWKHQIVLLFQNGGSGELYAFLATNPTSRGACHNLMAHCTRRARTGRDDYPLVRLKAGGYERREPPKVWVHKPEFAIVGHQQKSETTHATDAGIKDDMSDSIDF